MRLLLINYEFPPIGGGAGTATAALAREFAALGIEVRVLTSAFDNLPRQESRDGFTIQRIPVIRRRADRSSVFEMITFMLSACWHALWLPRPDASLAFFGIPGGPVALWLKWTRGVPYVVSLRGGDVPGHQAGQLDRHHAITRPLIKLIWRNARAVVANSNGLRNQALQTLPHLAIPVIPNGVDAGQFAPDACPDTRHPTPDTLSLLFVGRLSPEKALPTVLDALATLRERAWTLTIIGDGPDRAALETQAARLGIADRVIFAGWVPRAELPDRYRRARIFVFASTDEGMPNTVLEAMASGLPVVACRIPGCEDLVQDGVTGRLVPPRDPAALAEAIAGLLGNAGLCAAMSRAARARVLAQFTWRRAAESYQKLLAN